MGGQTLEMIASAWNRTLAAGSMAELTEFFPELELWRPKSLQPCLFIRMASVGVKKRKTAFSCCAGYCPEHRSWLIASVESRPTVCHYHHWRSARQLRDFPCRYLSLHERPRLTQLVIQWRKQRLTPLSVNRYWKFRQFRMKTFVGRFARKQVPTFQPDSRV